MFRCHLKHSTIFSGNQHAKHALEKRGAKGQRSLVGFRQYVRGPHFAWEPISVFKVRQRSMTLREHESYTVTNCRIRSVLRALKKDSSLRIILDARKANRYFRRPPVAPMVTGEGLSNIELDPAEPDQSMASGDIRNAFHCLLIPSSLGSLFLNSTTQC